MSTPLQMELNPLLLLPLLLLNPGLDIIIDGNHHNSIALDLIIFGLVPKFVQVESHITLAHDAYTDLNNMYLATNDTIMYLQDAPSNLKMKEGTSVVCHVVAPVDF